MNLQDVIQKIKDLRTTNLELDKKIHYEQEIKNKSGKIQEAVKLMCMVDIYGSDQYKKDKQRELALKKAISEMNDQNFIRSLLEIQKADQAIYDYELKKSENFIEIEFCKNVLRVAEVEAAKFK